MIHVSFCSGLKKTCINWDVAESKSPFSKGLRKQDMGGKAEIHLL